MSILGLRCTLAACLSLVAVSAARAQFHDVIPPANESVDGTSNNFIPLGVSDGAFQVIYSADQLVGLPIGASIHSLQMRQSNSATAPWPPANTTIADYEIRLGTSTLTPATRSSVFANNITESTLVRDGALTFVAGAFPGGPNTGTTPEDWGPVLTFTTPYVYRGGPLVIEIRNSGGAPSGPTVDCVESGTSVGSVSTTSSQTATSGAISNSAAIVRLGYAPASPTNQTVPPANGTAAGNAGNSIPIGAYFSSARHLTLYNTDQLAAIPPGSFITGMQLRQRNSATAPWPTVSSTTSYSVWLGQSGRTPATISINLADNLQNSEQVRSAPLILPAGAYPGGANAGATPEGWGPLIAFDSAYVYRGGVLALMIGTSGGITPITSADTLLNSASAAGVSDEIANPTGVVAGALIVRFQFIPPVASPFGEGVTKIYALKQFADTSAGSSQSAWAFSNSISNQVVFNAAQFQTVGPGTELTGLSFRNATTVAWPTAPASASSYSLELSRSLNGPSTLSTTVANNTGPDNTTVRSGALNLPTGIMAAKPAIGTGAFTWEIPFDQPYSYRFGDLLTVGRATAITPGSAGSVEALPVTNPAIGVETKGFFTVGAPGPVISSNANVPVMRFSADAQVMTPNSLATGAGFVSVFALDSPLASDPATYQNIIAASELEYIPLGGLITSAEFFGTGIAWPSGVAWADEYQVTISTSKNRPDSASATFSDNDGADSTIVRSGPISWTAGSLPLSSTVGVPGARITFDRAFVYTGGDLCITFRHSGVQNGGPTLRTAGTTATNRGIRSPDQLGLTGVFFSSQTGVGMRLGYIPSAVTPKSELLVPQGSGRFIFVGSRAFQMLYNANQIAVPVGATINGVSFKLDSFPNVAFPPTALTLDRFDITMSSAARDRTNASTTFATNEGADVTTVRSGPITIPPGAYPGTNPQREFGLFISFTRPFVYKGGPLSMLIRTGTASGADGQVNFSSTSIGATGIRNTASADALTGTILGDGVAARFAFTDDAFCFSDLNNDGQVDDGDFQVFVLSYNILDCADPAMALGCPGDLNFDRVVDDGDFQIFILAYDELVCP